MTKISKDTDSPGRSPFYYMKKSLKKPSVRKDLLLCFIGSLISIVAYAPLAFSKGYCADLEYMFQGDGFYNWSEIGRFNLILLKYIASFGKYRPFLEGILFSLTLAALYVALFIFFTNINRNASTVSGAFAAVLSLIFPTFAEQYYFRFQCFEVAFSMLLLVIANIFLTDFIRTKKWQLAVIAVILPALSFGTYQSMMNVAVTFYFGMFILMLFEFDDKKIKFGAISCTLQFISSLALYKIITLIFCEKGSYIGNKVMWGQFPLSTCYHFVVHYVRVVLFGEKYVYTLSFLICILLAFVTVILLFAKEKAKAIWVFLGFAGLCASPFILAIIQGFEAEARTQLALPFATGFLWLFFANTFMKRIEIKKKSLSRISFISIGLLSVIVFGLNSFKTEKLIKSGLEIVKSDLSVSNKIIGDLKNYNCLSTDSSSKPVIIIGLPDTESKNSLYTYNDENKLYILTSVYSLDCDVTPKYFFSTNRALGFYSFLGTDFNRPDVSDYMQEAYELSDGMPSYPNNGYIFESENCIVVNL